MRFGISFWASSGDSKGAPLNRTMRIRALILCVAALLIGCAGPATSGPNSPGPAETTAGPVRVRAAVLDAPSAFYRPSSGGFIGTRGISTIEMMANSGFSVVDNRLALRPQLAEAVPSIENGLWVIRPDGRAETTWRIRDGVAWHDGAPFTSADVLFGMTIRRDAELDLEQPASFSYVETIEAPDPRSVRVTWRQPYIEADGFFSTGNGLWPKHVLERPYREDKANLMAVPYWTTAFVGSGPFRLKEWAMGSHVILVANQAYVLGRPQIDEIEVRFFADSNVLFANLMGGGVDVALGKAITTEQGLEAQRSWNEGRVEIAASRAIRMRPQFLYPDPPIMLELSFRRALYHATNRQEIVDGLMGGLSFPADDFIISPNDPPIYDTVKDRIARYPYDPRRAAQLIEGLGYTRGADGLFRGPSGQSISIGIRTNTQDLNQRITLTVADHWRQIGIQGTPEVYTLQQGGDQEWRAKFPGVELIRSGYTPDDFHCKQQKTAATNWRGGNSGYCNREFDALLERYLVTIPLQQRVALYGDLIHHLSDQVVVMPILWDVEPIMIGKRLENITAGESNHAWNAHAWSVKR